MSIKITPKPSSGNISFVDAQNLYIDPNGSDSTGSGSQQNPYKTITHALSTVTDASVSKPYVLYLGTGTYAENVTAKPYVYLVAAVGGYNGVPDTYASSVIINGNLLFPDSASGRFIFQNIYFAQNVQTYTTSTTATGDIFFINCNLGGTTITIGSSNDTSADVTCSFQNCQISAQVTLYTAQTEFRSSIITNIVVAYGSDVWFTNSPCFSSLTFYDNAATANCQAFFYGAITTYSVSNVDCGSAVSCVITSDTIFADSVLSNSGGGTLQIIYLISQARAINSNTVLIGDANVIEVTTNASNIVLTLPKVVDYIGAEITIVKVDSGAGHVVITAASGDGIGASTTNTITSQYSTRKLYGNSSSKWYITSSVGS